MASINSTKELLEAEIKDLYSAEKLLSKAIPKMVAGAKDEDLKAGLKAHLEETKVQITRLERIAELLDVKASGKVCKGMEGVIQEGAEALTMNGPKAVFDLGIIAAARRVEHYEMAGYMTAITLAEGLGMAEVAELLNETLIEEQNQEAELKSMMPRMISEAGEADSMPVQSAGKATQKKLSRTA